MGASLRVLSGRPPTFKYKVKGTIGLCVPRAAITGDPTSGCQAALKAGWGRPREEVGPLTGDRAARATPAPDGLALARRASLSSQRPRPSSALHLVGEALEIPNRSAKCNLKVQQKHILGIKSEEKCVSYA